MWISFIVELNFFSSNKYCKGKKKNLPWETDETWCCCACRRSLCVPLGMQFTALPIQSATSTLAMVLPDILLSVRPSFFTECSYRCSLSKVCFTRDGGEVCSSANFYVMSRSHLPVQSAPLRSPAPVCRLAVWGSDLSRHGLASDGGGRSNKETDNPRSESKKWATQTFYDSKVITQISTLESVFLFFCLLKCHGCLHATQR